MKAAAAPTAAAPELVEVDPATLVVGANVRFDPRVDKDFVASIRERGVLVPITAYRDQDGRLVVLQGQRRTLAAVDAGRATVWVTVVDRPAETDRVIDQVSENDHREALTAGERVDAYQQLAAFGLTPAQIAKRTATKRGAVDAGLTVAKSAPVRAAAERGEFTIDQAAKVVEFADDPDAVKTLASAAQHGGFDHKVQQLRSQREWIVGRDAAREELRATGLTVIDTPGWEDKRIAQLDQLRDDAGEELTAAGHATCPGHAAFVDQGYADEPDDDTDTDTDTDTDEDEEDAELVWLPVYVCTDWATHGHTHRWRTHGAAAASAPAEPSQAQREEARAQRRDVIQSNKDWDSAEVVRLQWLRRFLARKTAPKTAVAFIAGSLARPGEELISSGGNRLAHELLGAPGQLISYGASVGVRDLADEASGGRAEMIALGLVLAAYEHATDRNHWRSVRPTTARYLRYLQANGYELAAVELRACGEKPEVEA